MSELQHLLGRFLLGAAIEAERRDAVRACEGAKRARQGDHGRTYAGRFRGWMYLLTTWLGYGIEIEEPADDESEE